MSRTTGDPVAQFAPHRALAAYGVRVHEALGDEGFACSPLGAYVLLAAAALAATGETRARLEQTLGCSAESATAWLSSLLDARHPAVSAAYALWHHEAMSSAKYDDWERALPGAIERGPIPTEAAASRWVEERTGGQIDRFPGGLDPEALIVLVSTIATRCEWDWKFCRVNASELGDGDWARRLRFALSQYGGPLRAFYSTRTAGVVAAQIANSRRGVKVVSVIAAPEISPPLVVAAAHDIAALECGLASDAVSLSHFDMPLGEGHAWTMTETRICCREPGTRIEMSEILLPAWRFECCEWNLLEHPSLGFPDAADSLLALAPPDVARGGASARQATTAHFHRLGFAAAAATAVVPVGAAGGGGRPETPYEGFYRKATVRFSRPFAAVAVACDGMDSPPGTSPWHGIPFLSAWVTDPTDEGTD